MLNLLKRKKKYYRLTRRDRKEFLSAFCKYNLSEYEQIASLDGKSEMPFDFKVVRMKETPIKLIVDDNVDLLKTVWWDFMPNTLSGTMMSERLKNVIEEYLTGEEHVDWISCNVRCKDESRVYYMMRFNKKLDVLDMEKTLFFEDEEDIDDETEEEKEEKEKTIYIPVYSLAKIKKLSVFHKPSSYNFWRLPLVFYVNEDIRKRIKKEKLTGMAFEKAVLSK